METEIMQNSHPKYSNSIRELLKFGPVTLDNPMSTIDFYHFHQALPDLLMERDKHGRVTIMSPVKKGSGKRESLLQIIIGMWVLETGLGEIYSPSTGIELPDSSIKSPDLAWISDEKLAQLPENADEEFLKVVPDFVVEIRSSSDSLKKLQEKMTEVWMANGVNLGWLIDPYSERVWIYREGQEPEIVKEFVNRELSGETVMPGMVFPLEKMRVE
ncbi:MAG: Uma2 family endonuclease [Bacteroidetes bacterium]|nr:Uma2 family endonuclease [Bacteroidota bacterium]